MVSKSKIAMLMATIFLAMAYATVSEDKKDDECNKDCMPTCLKVDDATLAVCEDVCKNFCQEQGADLPQQGTTNQLSARETNFDMDRFMRKTRKYMTIKQKLRKDKAN